MALVRNSIETLTVDPINFDITADWEGSAGVSDEASFIDFLEKGGVKWMIKNKMFLDH